MDHQMPDRHAGHQAHAFLTKFWIALVLSIPIFFYSEMARSVFHVQGPLFPGWPWMLLGLGSIVFFYCGFPFSKGAAGELRARQPGMMTLIALATAVAYGYSAISILRGTGHDLFFELSTLIAIMLLGHFIEMRSVGSAQGALRELAALLPDTAEVIEGGEPHAVPLGEVGLGNMVLVRPGGKVPVDGEVVSGRSEVNESLITGESAPVGKETGDKVIAGSINGDGSLTVRVLQIGKGTFLSGVMRLVTEAEASKSRLQTLADRAAFYLTFTAIGAGSVTFAAWLFAGSGFTVAVERSVSVLVIACPHALGLAIPLVAAISTGMAAKSGFLVRDRRALEEARTVDMVLFDKTGTLTEGTFSVISASSDEALALAAAVEAHSEHPIGSAVVEEARARGLKIEEAHDFRRIPGRGVEAVIGTASIFVGHRGEKDIVVQRDGKNIGTIAVADVVRPEARAAIASLKDLGIEIAMITGDAVEVAQKIAGELGIAQYFARVKPEEKSQKVRTLQSQGKKVVMVGDGINDAPALAAADIGIAIGAGTTVAIESAGIILIKNDPRDIAKIIRLSRLTYAKMIQNLLWATGYNVVAIPLAGGALAAYGILLAPAVAAILMSVSTVIVALNAILLRRRVL